MDAKSNAVKKGEDLPWIFLTASTTKIVFSGFFQRQFSQYVHNNNPHLYSERWKRDKSGHAQPKKR